MLFKKQCIDWISEKKRIMIIAYFFIMQNFIFILKIDFKLFLFDNNNNKFFFYISYVNFHKLLINILKGCVIFNILSLNLGRS